MLVWSLAGLGLAALAVADRDRARRGAAGLVLVALGTLSLLIGAGTLDPGRLARIAMTAAVPPWFLEVSLSLVGLGLLIAIAGTRSWLVGAGALAVAFSLRLLLAGTSIARTGIALLLLAVTVGGLTLAAWAVRERLRRPATLQEEPRSPGRPFQVTVALGLIALISPWYWLTGAAAAAAFLVVLGLSLRRSQRVMAVSSALLVPAGLVVLAAVGAAPVARAGPAAGSVGAGHALLVAGLLLVPSAVGMAAWPCHRVGLAVGLAPAALALMDRIAVETVPLGLAWWLPAVFPVALVGVFRGLLASQGVAAAGSLGWLGLWIGTPASLLGALLLAATALAAPHTSHTRNGAQWAGSRILWASGGAGGVLVLWGGLTAQVAYSALLALLAAAALLQPRSVAASTGTA